MTSLSGGLSSPAIGAVREVFALTDEQILGMEPEQEVASDEWRVASEKGATARTGTQGQSEDARQQIPNGESALREKSSQAGVAVPREAPGWLVERMKDPWSGQEAREFWDGAQKAERDAAAYREAFATPEDAKALKEMYPGGVAEAKGAVERARQLEEVDAAYFGAAGKASAELSSARVALAERLFAQDPAAFREMVAVGMRLVGGTGNDVDQRFHVVGGPDATSKPGSLRSVAGAPNYGAGEKAGHSGPLEDRGKRDDKERSAAENQVGAGDQLRSFGPAKGAEPQDDSVKGVATGYVEFEKAANAELEKSVGGTIARMMDEALPNLKRMGNVGREGQAPPLQVRLADAVRDEVDAGLKSDGQLGEQVAKILSGRRFDEAARRQVVRLIDARAQQLVPGAVRRVVGSWTQGTLGGARKAEDAPKREEAPPSVGSARTERAAKDGFGAGNNAKKSEAARGTAAGRAVDYRRFSDEQILDF